MSAWRTHGSGCTGVKEEERIRLASFADEGSAMRMLRMQSSPNRRVRYIVKFRLRETLSYAGAKRKRPNTMRYSPLWPLQLTDKTSVQQRRSSCEHHAYCPTRSRSSDISTHSTWGGDVTVSMVNLRRQVPETWETAFFNCFYL